MDDTKRRYSKFIFLLVVAVIIIGITISKYFGHHEEKKQTEEYTASTESVAQTTDEDSGYIANEGEGANQKEATKNKEQENTSLNENPYLQIYDEKTYGKVENISKEVAALWISQDTDKTKWQPYVKTSFFNEIKKKIANTDGVTRKVNEVIINPTEPNTPKEIKVEAAVSWTILSHEKIISKQTRVVFISLKQSSKNNWLVNRIEAQ